eukprot:11164936-Lingulodinium_polyedra.AAC.1
MRWQTRARLALAISTLKRAMLTKPGLRITPPRLCNLACCARRGALCLMGGTRTWPRTRPTSSRSNSI